MQKIKEKLHMGRNKHGQDEYEAREGATAYDSAYNTTGISDTMGTGGTMGTMGTGGEVVGERPVGMGVAEVPVVVTEQERLGREHLGHEHLGHEHRHHEHMGAGERIAGGVGEEVCGVKTFTEVEDRPVVKERVERILEHRPVEKQYEVETRFVGERAVPSATGATVIDTDERIIEAAEPGPKCPVGAGQMMDQVIGGMGGTTGTGMGTGMAGTGMGGTTGTAYDPNLDPNRRI